MISSVVLCSLKSINQTCQLMTQCRSFPLSKNRNWGKVNPHGLHIFVLHHNGFTSEKVLSHGNIIHCTYCSSTGRLLNLKRICTWSVMYKMMQYTAMTQSVTFPSPKKRMCTSCQTHDRKLSLLLCEYLFSFHLFCMLFIGSSYK